MNMFHYARQLNPAILCIILGIVIVIFLCGLVIFLVKLLKKPRFSSIFQSSRNLDISGSSALQRQLQNLFNLHDSGLDQAIIDSLPMFIYKDIMGLNSPFDCPVCLCEFIDEDKLRLLPLCKHAFHLHCIDTWLISSSTCPLCRNTLLNQSFELDDSRNEGFSLNVSDNDITVQKPDEPDHVQSGKKVFSLRLGKFRHNKNEDMEMGENSVIDSRRCFSMGCVEYVVDDKEFQVELLCCDESNDLKVCSNDGKLISNGNKRESFSISKVWLWPNKSKEKHFSRPFNTSLSNSMVQSSMEEESSIVITDTLTQGETRN